MLTVRELGERGIMLRSLREGIDTLNHCGADGGRGAREPGRAWAGIGQGTALSRPCCPPGTGPARGRPRALDHSKAALARRMHTAREPVQTIAEMLGVAAATAYRVVALS